MSASSKANGKKPQLPRRKCQEMAIKHPLEHAVQLAYGGCSALDQRLQRNRHIWTPIFGHSHSCTLGKLNLRRRYAKRRRFLQSLAESELKGKQMNWIGDNSVSAPRLCLALFGDLLNYIAHCKQRAEEASFLHFFGQRSSSKFAQEEQTEHNWSSTGSNLVQLLHQWLSLGASRASISSRRLQKTRPMQGWPLETSGQQFQ